MLRKSLLVIVAIVLSYGLTALAAYILYAYSDRLSERHMSLLVQFVINRERFVNHRLVTGTRNGVEGCDSSEVTNLPLVGQPIG
jgi:hypothetical protein